MTSSTHRMARRFTLPTTVPHWATLLAGLLLGCVLTSTFTFHMRWCSDKVSLSDLSLDRQTVSIIRVNEHIRAHGKGISVDGGWERNVDTNVDAQEPEWNDCVCGNELKKLKAAIDIPTGDLEKYRPNSLDSTYRPSTFITKPSLASFSPGWNYSKSNRGNYSTYNHPLPLLLGGKSREQVLSEEFLLRRSFIVAVNVPDNGLRWANEIFDTWGQDVPQIIFFISESFEEVEPEAIGLPLVKLKGINGSGEALRKPLAILQYLHDNHREAFHWFVMVGTQTFVRGQRMEEVLSRFDSSEKVYLGWAARGRPEEADLLQLLPHENYCLGAPGMVFSKASLTALGGHLGFCQHSLERHNREEEKPWMNWDVEIGRCVSRTIGIQCSQSAEVIMCIYDILDGPL